MKRQNLLILIVLLLIGITGCCSRFYFYDGPYHGKVIDYYTKEPIKGVPVVGTWSTLICTPAGSVGEYYDTQEAVTDKNGEFTIPGHGLRIMSSISPMSVTIFKFGYGYSYDSWDNFDKKDDKGRTIIRLAKLTLEQLKKGIGAPSGPGGPIEKWKHYLKEYNKYRIERGFKPY